MNLEDFVQKQEESKKNGFIVKNKAQLTIDIEDVNEGLLSDLIKKFKELFNAKNETIKKSLTDNFEKSYPKWTSAYDNFLAEENEDAAIKKLNEIIKAVDGMQKNDKNIQMDDNQKAAQKVIVLTAASKHADEKKFTKLKAEAEKQLEEVTKANANATQLAQDQVQGKTPAKSNEEPSPIKDKKAARQQANDAAKAAENVTGVDAEKINAAVTNFLVITQPSESKTYNDLEMYVDLITEALTAKQIKEWIAKDTKNNIPLVTNIIASIKALADALKQKDLTTVAPFIASIIKDPTINAALNGEQQKA